MIPTVTFGSFPNVPKSHLLSIVLYGLRIIEKMPTKTY